MINEQPTASLPADMPDMPAVTDVSPDNAGADSAVDSVLPVATTPILANWFSRANIVTALLLAAILLLGGYLRFSGQNWDDFTMLHPDERFLTGVASVIGVSGLNINDQNPSENAARTAQCQQNYPKTGGVGGYFDALCSNLYPPNVGNGEWVYGELPLFVTHFAGQFLAGLVHDPSWAQYGGIQLVGRTVSAVADLLTIFFVFLIGRRLYNRWVGLLGAFFYAVATLPIQQSHFWTVDAFSNLPVAIGFYFAARALDKCKWYDCLGFGVAFGAAIASRINLIPLFGILGLAVIIYALPTLDLRTAWSERRRLAVQSFWGLVIAAIAGLVTFRFAYPHAFTGPGIFGLIPNPNFLYQIQKALYENSGNYDGPPNYQWISRPPYLFAWRNLVEWGTGLPFGLIAWAGWLWGMVQIVRARPNWTRQALPVVWILVYFGLFGRGWVSSMRYFMPLYPMLALLASWLLIELFKRARAYQRAHPALVRRLAVGVSVVLAAFVIIFTGLWAYGFNQIHTRLLTRDYASQWVFRNLPASVSAQVTGPDGITRLLNMPYGGTTSTDPYSALTMQRAVDIPGTFQAIDLRHALSDPLSSQDTLHVKVYDQSSGKLLGQGQVTANFSQKTTSPLGDQYHVPLDQPVTVADRQAISIAVYTDKFPVTLTGTAIATEGAWDDPLPWKVCLTAWDVPLNADTPSGLTNNRCDGTDGFGQGYYKGYEMYLVADETAAKRTYIQTGMDSADYITSSSNRFYDTLPRDPARFPMTTAYYKALFAGQLGYSVEKVFTSEIHVGPFAIPDLVLPTDNLPSWVKEWWQSEEAFSVYDHPAVYLLKKNADYSPAVVTAQLNSVNINNSGVIQAGSYDNMAVGNLIQWPTLTGNAAPTGFMLTPNDQNIQQNGGTWSDIFFRNSPLNTAPLIAVVVWYALLFVFGALAFPLLFTILPGLADRGYAIAKLAGLLIVAWLVWAGATLHFLVWTPAGILAAMALLGLISVLAVFRRRTEFFAHLRTHGRYFLIVEGLTIALFLGFVLVRLGNPDLWAQTLGGEKPMDFSYLNAVLRSTVFPPYDPWYSGGYMNYYYFGYVLVGTPVKLLGIMPSIGYNLILPMLYAFTGIGAFAVAYNLVASRLFTPRDDGDSDPSASFKARRRWALRAPAGSPYVAGIGAIVLCVMIGNLDTPRVLLSGIAANGGYTNSPQNSYDTLLQDFVSRNKREPTDAEILELQRQATHPSIGSQLNLSLIDTQRYLDSLQTGVSRVISMGYLPISPDRWFWAPTRILGELPNASSEIVEMPYFTFVYADLHAHMIDMPIELLVMAWLLAEILGAGTVKRRTWIAIAATLFGALTVGVTYATNSWDWYTYMIMAMAGLIFAAFLRGGPFNRRTIITFVAQVVGFFAAQQIAGLPFRTYFATAFSSVELFRGNKSPIWAYLDIHGVFLFFIVSLLVWQTARVLRRTYIRDLVGRVWTLLLILAVIVISILITALLTSVALPFGTSTGYPTGIGPFPIAIICVPLLTWTAILFFLPDQSREMRVVLGLIGLGIGLTFGVEVIVLQGDIGRQNTIFKFYEQVWLMFSVLGGIVLAWLLRASERWQPILRSPWLAFCALLISVAALFPVMATQGKIAMRMAPQAPHTLNGLDYMKDAVYVQGDKSIPLVDDLNLITWLQDHIQGSPVVLEAQLPEYQLGSRIAMNTGLPTVLGYRFHQSQQRTLEPMGTLIWGRVANIGTMYNTSDIAVERQLLRAYNVKYIVVGGIEHVTYNPDGLAKFDAMVQQGLLKVAYDDGKNTKLYEVLPVAVSVIDVTLGVTQ
jgi:YYY domain-containing protein